VRRACRRARDIGEADGRLFLSMEYVDGEDLGSLLRRTASSYARVFAPDKIQAGSHVSTFSTYWRKE
jgi:hypothetical protein